MEKVDPARIQCVNEIFEALSLDAENVEDLSSDLEKECFISAIETARKKLVPVSFKNTQFVSEYSINIHRVMALISPSHRGDSMLYWAFINGDITAEDLVRKEPDELLPRVNETLRHFIHKRANAAIMNKVSRAYRCKICGQNKTTYDKRQVAGGDEGATLFIICLTCGERWQKR